MEQQRLHQEERVRRALERAKADPKKKVRIITGLWTLFTEDFNASTTYKS